MKQKWQTDDVANFAVLAYGMRNLVLRAPASLGWFAVIEKQRSRLAKYFISLSIAVKIPATTHGIVDARFLNMGLFRWKP